MNNDQFFQHKLETIFGQEITQTYQDETGYYVQINHEWYLISKEPVNQKTSTKIDKMITEIKSSQK